MVELFNLFFEVPNGVFFFIKELLFEGLLGKRRIPDWDEHHPKDLRCLKIDMTDNSMKRFRFVFG